MKGLQLIWDFIQNQILGMKWLNDVIGAGLEKLGIDLATRLGGTTRFFLYDTIKITVLLCFLIFAISYIQSYFPPERSKRILDDITAFRQIYLPHCWGQLRRFVPVRPFRFLSGLPKPVCRSE